MHHHPVLTHHHSTKKEENRQGCVILEQKAGKEGGKDKQPDLTEEEIPKAV